MLPWAGHDGADSMYSTARRYSSGSPDTTCMSMPKMVNRRPTLADTPTGVWASASNIERPASSPSTAGPLIPALFPPVKITAVS